MDSIATFDFKEAKKVVKNSLRKVFEIDICDIYLGKLYRPHCDLTGIMVNKGNHPQMALIQVSELL